MERGLNVVRWVPGSANEEEPKLTDWRFVTPEYFQVMRIPLVAGRMFTDADGPQAEGVVLINRQFAKEYFGGETPGRRAMQIMQEKPVAARRRKAVGGVDGVE